MRLYVNIDHVATVREARRADEPDPVRAAAAAERGGADGVTVHLREDRRHIQDADVRALRAAVRTVLNLELGAAPEIVRIACRVKPFQATLVPERRQEITTEGGLALRGADRRIRAAVERLTAAGIRVSLFIDPDPEAIDRAAALGVPAVELHTGRYARAWRKSDAALRALARAAAHARARGLAVHAGHGLTYDNVQPVAALREIEELNIGHSIVSNAIYWGLEEAVRRMRKLVDEARERGEGRGTLR
jgi:pyridoxine 5-phosphate synthase